MECGRKRHHSEGGEPGLAAIAKRTLFAGSSHNAPDFSSASGEDGLSAVYTAHSDSEASSSSTMLGPKWEALPAHHASKPSRKSGAAMDACVSSCCSSCIMVEDDSHERSRMQAGKRAMHLDSKDGALANISCPHFSHSLISTQTCLSSISQSVSHSEAGAGATCRHDLEGEYIPNMSILRENSVNGNPGVPIDTIVIGSTEEKQEEPGMPAEEALTMNWEAGKSFYQFHHPFSSSPDSEITQSMDETLSLKYVLSSGRLSMEQETQMGKRIPTIDQEFEEYFAALML